VTRRQQTIKRTLVADAGGCCSICGYDRCIPNLHFHHVNPADKSFAMSTATGKSLAAYREEAKKCILVCANCHGEIEAGLVRTQAPQPPVRDAPHATPPQKLPKSRVSVSVTIPFLSRSLPTSPTVMLGPPP
jgi:hypothetical protein